MSQKELFFIQQAGSLLQMPRAHTRTLGTTFDTIASHSFHVATIAYVISKMEGLTDQEAQKACTIAVFHDVAEARTGDHDFIAKKYNECDEERATKDQCKHVVGWDGLLECLEEYEQRKSKIAQCVKDADHLAQMYHERVLMWQWNKLAQQRREDGMEKRVPYFFTESAKSIIEAMKQSNPNERRRDEFVANNYSHTDLVWKSSD